MIRLRITAEIEFDSQDTANAYGVAYGWALNTITETALKTSEAPAPTVRRTRPIEVVEVTAAQANG
jgi:hypothetical protein